MKISFDPPTSSTYEGFIYNFDGDSDLLLESSLLRAGQQGKPVFFWSAQEMTLANLKWISEIVFLMRSERRPDITFLFFEHPEPFVREFITKLFEGL